MRNVGYGALAYEYDDYYRKKDYRREASHIHKFLSQKHVKTLLDVGCGTGTHMALLEQYGLHVTGLDLNLEMLEVAKSKVKGELHHGDMNDFSLSKTFDSILCLFAAFNHNLNLGEARKTLQCFKRHLSPGGIIFLDLYNAKNSGSKIDRGKDVDRKMEWTFDPETKITKTSISYILSKETILNAPFLMRQFSLDEVQELLKSENFVNIQFWDDFSDVPGNSNSKNLIATAQLG